MTTALPADSSSPPGSRQRKTGEHSSDGRETSRELAGADRGRGRSGAGGRGRCHTFAFHHVWPRCGGAPGRRHGRQPHLRRRALHSADVLREAARARGPGALEANGVRALALLAPDPRDRGEGATAALAGSSRPGGRARALRRVGRSQRNLGRRLCGGRVERGEARPYRHPDLRRLQGTSHNPRSRNHRVVVSPSAPSSSRPSR